MRTSKTWIQTFHGRQFFPLDAHPDEVHLDDIAWMLAGQNRWKGATYEPMNIAHHSFIVSNLCEPEYAAQGLLHDATEAYLGDMAGPIKAGLPDFVRAEKRLWEVICERFKLPVEIHPSVKHADMVSLHTESVQLMRPPPVEWRNYLPPPMSLPLVPWPRDTSAAMFLARAKRLGLK